MKKKETVEMTVRRNHDNYSNLVKRFVQDKWCLEIYKGMSQSENIKSWMLSFNFLKKR